MYNIDQCKDVVMHHNKAASISQALMTPEFFELSRGGDQYGIFGCTRFGILHTLFLGMMKYSLQCIFEYGMEAASVNIMSHPSRQLNCLEFECKVRIMSSCRQCQSDRMMPRSIFNTGVTTLSGIQGQEQVGLSLLTIVCLPGMLGELALEKKFMNLLWLGLRVYAMLSQDVFPRRDLPYIHKTICE